MYYYQDLHTSMVAENRHIIYFYNYFLFFKFHLFIQLFTFFRLISFFLNETK